MFPCAIKVWSISHLQIKGNKYPGSQVNFCTKALTAISPWDSRVSRTFRVCSVMSNSLRPHRLQHARLPCPSIISQNWLKLMSIESVMPPNHLILCHPLLLPSIFPSIRSFPMSWLFASGGQRIGASASAPVLPKNIQDWFSFRIDWFDLFAVQGTLKSLLQQHSSKASILLYGPTLTSIRDHWKNHGFDYEDLCGQSNVSAGVGGALFSLPHRVMAEMIGLLIWSLFSYLPHPAVSHRPSVAS